MARFLIALAGLWTLLIARRRRRRLRLPARAVIISPRKSTTISSDGAVESVQSAVLTLSPADLERLWTPANLENLGRTYWRFLSRVTLGLIRVAYTEHDRSVMLLIRPLTLLRFDKPEYELEPGHGSVRWQIRDGLLVARSGRSRGYLALDVRRVEPRRPEGTDRPGEPSGTAVANLRIEVAVSNFYPSIAARFSTPVYSATQSFFHVLVTHAFLRSLAGLDLAQSRIRRLADVVVEAASAATLRPGAAANVGVPSGAAVRPTADGATRAAGPPTVDGASHAAAPGSAQSPTDAAGPPTADDASHVGAPSASAPGHP